ncbi:hypothetical protein K435DRAFT_777954 [Dendrothele bispora CBS 962.96]|uniref:Uncharacterized protein n=1 Tax=Dendrothele bispora (strain CBS 962.96) TaxID=1314807 RepID=A0A4V4HG69_DENBC|nr:hypothetical protein K435DRAFT_777954 [Dendrothele bispora CBS 962.96]
MSRLPPLSTRDRSRSPMKPSPSPSKSRMGTTTPVRATTPVRTSTKSSTGPRKPVEKEEPPPTPTVSIKEQIALKRVEAKKAMTARRWGWCGLNDMSSLEDAVPGTSPLLRKKISSDDGLFARRLNVLGVGCPSKAL